MLLQKDQYDSQEKKTNQCKNMILKKSKKHLNFLSFFWTKYLLTTLCLLQETTSFGHIIYKGYGDLKPLNEPSLKIMDSIVENTL